MSGINIWGPDAIFSGNIECSLHCGLMSNCDETPQGSLVLLCVETVVVASFVGKQIPPNPTSSSSSSFSPLSPSHSLLIFMKTCLTQQVGWLDRIFASSLFPTSFIACLGIFLPTRAIIPVTWRDLGRRITGFKTYLQIEQVQVQLGQFSKNL